jgi:antitoxin (DNA-binding transcriptional repressor) of toxin-antitoxin stability system
MGAPTVRSRGADLLDVHPEIARAITSSRDFAGNRGFRSLVAPVGRCRMRSGSVLTSRAGGVGRQRRLQRSTACYTSGMAREITQRELRNESGEIMRQLDEGESFIVTRNGVPVGELSPLRRHRFVRSDTAVALFRHAAAVDLNKLRDDLDGVASQDLSPRG